MKTKFIFVTGGVLSSLAKVCAPPPSARFFSTRASSHYPEARSLHQRGPRHHEPFQHGEYTSPTTAPRPIWTWAITSATWAWPCARTITSPLEASTTP